MPRNTAPALAVGYKGTSPADPAAVAVRSAMLTNRTSGLTAAAAAAAAPWGALLLALLALLGAVPAAAAPFPVHLVVSGHNVDAGARPWQEYPVASSAINGSYKPILPGTDHGLYNEGFFEGDIVGTKHTSALDDPDTKNAVTDPNLLWPSATVVYKVDDDVGCPESPQCAILMEAMEHYHRHTCIRFKQWTGEDNWVSIFFNSDSSGACWSPVGRVGDGEQRLSLGQRCWYRGIVIHELGHAIGFWHEMNRPDRDDWIYVYWQNIIPGFASAFKKHAQVNTLGEHFDYRSIMMYDEYAFSKDGRSPTLQATTGEEIGPIWKKKGLSGSDKRRIEKLYKCDLKKPMAGFPYNVNCDFNRHVCGFKNGGTPNWSWRTVNQTDGYVYTSFDVAGTTPGHFMSINFPPISEALESVRGELGCVRFYYLIETDGEAQLFLDQAYLKTSTQLSHDQDTTFELWANDTSSNEWIHMEIPLYVTRPFKLIFTSVFNGTATHGTIALDDVELLYTPCNPPATTTPAPGDGEGASSTTPAVMPAAPKPKPTTTSTTTSTTTTTTTSTTSTTTPAPTTATPDTSSPSSTSTSTTTEALSGVSSYMTTAEAEAAVQLQQLQQQQSILHAQQLLEQQQQKEQQQQLLAIAQQLQQHVTASGHHSARDPTTTTPRPTSTTFPTYETVPSTTDPAPDSASDTASATESTTTTTTDPDFPISLMEPFDSIPNIPNLPTPTDQMDMKPSTVSVLNYDESEDGR